MPSSPTTRVQVCAFTSISRFYYSSSTMYEGIVYLYMNMHTGIQVYIYVCVCTCLRTVLCVARSFDACAHVYDVQVHSTRQGIACAKGRKEEEEEEEERRCVLGPSECVRCVSVGVPPARATHLVYQRLVLQDTRTMYYVPRKMYSTYVHSTRYIVQGMYVLVLCTSTCTCTM